MFGCLFLYARVVGHIQAGNADRTGCPGNLHRAVQNHSRRLMTLPSFLAPWLRSDDPSRNRLPNAENLGDESPWRSCLVRSIGSKPTFFACASALFISPDRGSAPVRADAAAARPPALRRRRTQSTDADLGSDGAVGPSVNIGKTGQIADLFHCLRLIGKFHH
jgi:hypothetical protein